MRVLFLMLEPHQEPLGAGYLIAAAKRAGHVASGRFFNTTQQALKIVREERPSIVAFSVITGSQSHYASVASEIKRNFDVFTVFGGPHPTYSPDFIHQDGVDAICRGEGEHAFTAFLSAYENNEGYLSTPNFTFKTESGVVANALSPLIEDLDSLDFPDRDFFYSCQPLRSSHLKSFLASRGCPYKCTYCFNHVHNALYEGLGSVVRRRSVQNVIDEVIQVKNAFDLGMAQFMDDTFILSSKWLEEFAEEFPRCAGVDFFCNVRAELVNRDTVRDLVRAGCISVCLGIETGDTKLRREILERTQTDEQIIAACKLLKASGIKVMTTNMLGIPGGNLESDILTLKLNIACEVDYPWTSLTYPYPGTRIHDIAKSKGFDIPEADSLSHSYFNGMPFDSPDKNEIENLHRLLAIAAGTGLPLNLLRLLIKQRNGLARVLFTLAFGFWKLYCYETRIFRRRGTRFAFGGDFISKFSHNVTVGMKMMFSSERRS